MGFPDDRVLPSSSQHARNEIRDDYAHKLGNEVTAVVTGSSREAVDAYAERLPGRRRRGGHQPDAVFSNGRAVASRQSTDLR